MLQAEESPLCDTAPEISQPSDRNQKPGTGGPPPVNNPSSKLESASTMSWHCPIATDPMLQAKARNNNADRSFISEEISHLRTIPSAFDPIEDRSVLQNSRLYSKSAIWIAKQGETDHKASNSVTKNIFSRTSFHIDPQCGTKHCGIKIYAR